MCLEFSGAIDGQAVLQEVFWKETSFEFYRFPMS